MALHNTIQPEDARVALADWMQRHALPGSAVTVDNVVIPAASGLSAETLFFDAAWSTPDGPRNASLVARVYPSGPAVYPAYDIEREHHVLSLLAEEADVPSPEMRWLETDPSVLGSPFLIMERVAGRCPADDPPYTVDGWVLEISPDDQRALIENGLAALAAVHRTPVPMPERLVDPHWGAPGLDRELGYCHHYYRWASGGIKNPVLEATFSWLDDHRPADPEPLVLCWGDARIGNMLFDDALTVAAVVDFEEATLSSPELDIGWWLYTQRLFTEAIGVPAPRGFPTRDEQITRYQQLSGREVREIDYFETLAALKHGVMMMRAADLLTAAGTLPADSQMALNNPTTNVLAAWLGLPAPEGTTDNYVGNR